MGIIKKNQYDRRIKILEKKLDGKSKRHLLLLLLMFSILKTRYLFSSNNDYSGTF